MDLKDRERRLDLNQMTNEQVEQISLQVGTKVRDICDDAASKINAILGIYGASAKIAIKFDKLPNNVKQGMKRPRGRPRKSKADNLT